MAPGECRVAVVGAGLIGRGWTIVFARAGYRVRLYDVQSGACDTALGEIRARLEDLATYGLIPDAADVLARVQCVDALEDAVDGAILVQECVLETVAAKAAIFADLDRLTPPQTILASSSSAIPASAFSADLRGRGRCLVAHPANPPYLIPLVEIVPAPWTAPETIKGALARYREVGQEPIAVRRELHGFILNRLQGALLNEAFRLVEDGYVDADDVDTTIRSGLGLRWSFMGPFETIDLNAPAGIADYVARYGELYYEMAQQQARPRRWGAPLVQQLEDQRRRELPREAIGSQMAWRDKRLMRLAAHQAEVARDLPRPAHDRAQPPSIAEREA